MTDTSSQMAMRPPRIEEGYSTPTRPERGRFLGTARSMAAPALDAARESLEASRGGPGDFVLNMPLAALNLADAAARGGVGAFADLVPGLRPAARRDLAREVLGMGEAAAGSVMRVPSALDEGLGGLSEVARRMFQEGPVPDRLMSGIDPLAAFRAAREAMLGASRDTPFEDLQALSGAQAAAREAAVAALSDAPSVRLFNPGGRAVVVGPGMGPTEDGKFRVTYFDADREPTNHTVFETKDEALGAALREGFNSRTAAPAPRDFGFRQDNPALSRGDTEWLANKQRVADETYSERRGITGSTTAQLGQSTDMFLPTDVLRRIPGLNNENRRPGDPRYDELLENVRERGFLPDQDNNKVVLGINHRGEPFLIEGNTRVAVASDVGVSNVRAEVVYKNGGEMVDGPFSPNNVSRIAARGPESSETFGRDFSPAYHTTRSPVDFDQFDLSKSTSAMSQLGPHVGTRAAAEARVQAFPNDPSRMMELRADTRKPFLDPRTEQPWTEFDLEMFISAFADEHGIDRRGAAPVLRRRLADEGFTDIPYTNDVEDAGSISRIMLVDRPSGSDAVLRRSDAAFDPARRTDPNLMAGVGGAGVMVAASDDDEEPAVRGYAQGGAVMMRSDMPQQIHQGVGSLSEVARRMFQGGEVQQFQFGGAVGGHPLDQYGQYLTQTYAQPIQQSAQGAVDQFVSSVRQKEQNYFGGGGMGGGMGAPLQGGLMGSPMQPGGMQAAAHSALEASMPTPDQSGVVRDMISGGMGFLGSSPQGAMAASPFGTSLNQQQMMGQRRLDGMQPASAGGNEYNMRMMTERLTGQPTPSTFNGNRPGATSGQILGSFDIFQMGRNAGIV